MLRYILTEFTKSNEEKYNDFMHLSYIVRLTR